jgi:3-deoxy-D-manno-octulosonate 8-phosphate phosphatase (KDO 8-P phosphatase)
MKIELMEKFREIKIFLFDLDGVLLHGTEIGDECIIRCKNAAEEFKKLGVMFGIVTARKEDEQLARLKAIDNCYVFSSTIDKVTSTGKFLESNNIDYCNVFYIGDELLDVPLLSKCGVSCAPQNAKREVKRSVTLVTKSEHCEGLLDEIINYFRNSKEAVSHATKYK